MLDGHHEVLLRAYVDAFNQGDVVALRALFTADAEVSGALGWGSVDAVVPVWRELHAAFAFQLELEAVVAEGDTMVARFLERGTSAGAFRGQAPTGRVSSVVAIEWFTVRDRLIARRWGVRDSATHFRQMGLSTS